MRRRPECAEVCGDAVESPHGRSRRGPVPAGRAPRLDPDIAATPQHTLHLSRGRRVPVDIARSCFAATTRILPPRGALSFARVAEPAWIADRAQRKRGGGGMNLEFLSTVAVIAPDPPRSRRLYVDALGLPLEGERRRISPQRANCRLQVLRHLAFVPGRRGMLRDAGVAGGAAGSAGQHRIRRPGHHGGWPRDTGA